MTTSQAVALSSLPLSTRQSSVAFGRVGGGLGSRPTSRQDVPPDRDEYFTFMGGVHEDAIPFQDHAPEARSRWDNLEQSMRQFLGRLRNR